MPIILTERSIRDAEAVSRHLQVALAPVLENELKASGISVKKGYEDLVYEAVVHLAGEATPPSMRNEIALEKTRTVL